MSQVTNSNDAAKFIDLWQEFETALIASTDSTDFTKFRDALNKLATKNVYVKNRLPQIENLYALRNVFSHRNRGDYLANIESRAVNELQELLSNVLTPPTVTDIFGCSVYTADIEDDIITVMDKMAKNTFTHVPVYDKGRLKGVFSYTSLFDWLHKRQKVGDDSPVFTKRKMKDLGRQYLNSPSVNYVFIDVDTNAFNVPAIFEEKALKEPHPERLDCILISKNARKDASLEGVITSWDLGRVL